MKKYLVSMIVALVAMVSLNGCIVSESKLEDKVQQAIVDDESGNGNHLEVTEFNLDKAKSGKNYTGVLRGTLNGKEVVYDVTVNDEGNDFDVDWELRP